MAGNDDLHPILRSIHETLGDILKQIRSVRGEIGKVRTAITEGVENIRDAIHESIQAQAELKMMERVVEVRSILPQIEAEKERVETEQEELDEQIRRIAERYSEKHEELDEKAANRVRNLGSHIFEIDEEEFEEGIESPFAEHVTTAWSSLQLHNDTIGQNRRDRVKSTAGDVVTEVHDFVRRQEELVDRIDDVRTDIGEDIAEPSRMQVPYYTVTIETDEGTRNHGVVPSEVTTRGEGGNVALDPLPGVEELVSRTELKQTKTETIDKSYLRNEVSRWVDDDPPLVSYEDGLDMAVPDDLTIAMEED